MKLVRKVKHDYVYFKIIPHITNLNSTSRKFQQSLYELLSLREGRFPWQRKHILEAFKKDNLYLLIKPNPKFWWIVHMRGYSKDVDNDGGDLTSSFEQLDEDKDMYDNEIDSTNLEKDDEKEEKPVKKLARSIEFFICIPKEFKSAFVTKFHNHEQWKKATLEEIEVLNVIDDIENTDLYSLRYTRNDMFSLNFDYSHQNTPIRELLSISNELSEDESVSLFIQTEAVSRRTWKKVVDYYWSVWDRGRVPTSRGFDPNMIAYDITYVIGSIFYEIKSIIDDTLYSIQNMFFHGNKDVKPEKSVFIYESKERKEILVDGDLTKPTKNKRNKPVFKTDIFYTVKSKDSVKRDMLAGSVPVALSDLNGNNTLKPIKITIRPKKELDNLKKLDMDIAVSNFMSVDEVGKLQQLPTSEVQREFEEYLVSNKRVETDIDKELLDESGILAGTVVRRGERHNIHIQTKNEEFKNTSRVIIGSPRMGKDQAAINLVVEAKLKHNMGAVVLDVINERNGHRGMADAIRDHLPPEEVIDLDLHDYSNPIYLGLEPIVKMIEDKRIAYDRVAEEICSFLLQDGDEDKLQTSDFLREAAKLTNGDLLAIKHLFTSTGYRQMLLDKNKDVFDMDIWEQYNGMSEGRQQAIYTPIMRRIGQIINSEFLKPIFCQLPNNKLDLYKMISEGKVVIFRLKAGLMSQRVIDILCYWIVLVTFMIKLVQDGKATNSEGTYLILNEPHQYLTDGLVKYIERILVEGPKYKFSPVIIFHQFKQFRKFPGFVDVLKSSSLNWHIFKNTNGDVYKELYQDYLSKTFESPTHAFEATKRFQYIGVWLDSTGKYYDPFVADALPLVSDRYQTYDNSRLTYEHSKKYGRPIEDVLEEIKKRNREAIRLNVKA